MSFETTVTSKGTVTIAAPLRKALHIKPGQKLHTRLNEQNEIVLKPSTDMTAFTAKRAKITAKIPNHLKGLAGNDLRKAAAKAWTQK